MHLFFSVDEQSSLLPVPPVSRLLLTDETLFFPLRVQHPEPDHLLHHWRPEILLKVRIILLDIRSDIFRDVAHFMVVARILVHASS
jgi:hypothetical protein